MKATFQQGRRQYPAASCSRNGSLIPSHFQRVSGESSPFLQRHSPTGIAAGSCMPRSRRWSTTSRKRSNWRRSWQGRSGFKG